MTAPQHPTPKTPQFIFFDLDDTLLDHRGAEQAALADLRVSHAEHLGHAAVEALRDAYHAANAPLWADFAAGTITSDDLKRLRSQGTLDQLGVTGLSAGVFSDAYLAHYAERWTWMPGARDAFLAVAHALPVGILTNGFSAQQRAKLARFPEIQERASVAVISDEIGVMKPNRALFDHALAQACKTNARLGAADVLLVGDSLTSDVQGALGAGWQAVWIGGTEARAPRGVPVSDSVAAWADGLKG